MTTPTTTASLMTAFAGRRLAAEGKRRFGGWFGTGLHNRFLKRARAEAARQIAARGQFTEADALKAARNASDDQVYAAARTYAVQSGDIPEDADDETWWAWFKRVVLPVMIEIAKILIPIILTILISGT